MSKEDISKEIQPILRNMLEVFINICNKYDIRYFLIDGSLLGTVRHSGFIPWDDDIDIGIPRPDYERLCDIVKSELPDNMYFVSYEDSLHDGSIAEIARIYCSDLQLKMDYFGNDQSSDIWIDIMIMYGMPQNSFKRLMHYKFFYILKGFARMGRIEHIGGRSYNFVEKVLIWFARKVNLSKVLNTQKILLNCVKLLKKYPYDKSKYIIVVPSEYGANEIVPKSFYEPAIYKDFNNLSVRIPCNYDGVLRKLYGEYMVLPSIDKRINKHKITIVK